MYIANWQTALVQSESLADFYCKIYKISRDKVFVNYNHFDFEGLKKAHAYLSNSKKISIGFVGNIERHKGLSDMIKLCSRLPQEFQLVLAGKTKGYENKKLFRSLMATGRCIWKGQIQRDKILKFYMKKLIAFYYSLSMKEVQGSYENS